MKVKVIFTWDEKAGITRTFFEQQMEQICFLGFLYAFEMDEHRGIHMDFLAFFLFSLLAFSNAEISSKIGINYGRLGNNLPSPNNTIELIKNMKAGRVKIYDANPEILTLLSGTKLQVSIMVTNDLISSIASNQALADLWVRENVLVHYPGTMIRYILVGNEVLSYNTSQGQQLWHDLVPAMIQIRKSLRAHNIRNIKVGTPLAMDVLESTFPPSSGTFRSDIIDRVMLPLLHFLDGTRSFFFIDVYPYFPWSQNPTTMSLDFALFSGGLTYIDPVSRLRYTNLLDQMLDSLIFAMAKLGFGNVKLAIAETGWPNAGDIDQPGANIYNAATYNRNLVKKMTAKPPLGTPARPGLVIPTFIFSLYDENQKGGQGTERHWGLLHPNGRPVYELDLTGRSESSYGGQLPEPENNRPYQGNIWCVAASGVNLLELDSALRYACGEGNGTCDALEPGKECYEPVSLTAHASYAFSSFWAKFRDTGATCFFNGFAVQTTRDPSHGSCKFPSVSL
uniref:glucan endo-1,3-beta-D-glucosidase n=1 Tax=Actinidia deliciosa TaxID=3627 RepID=A0A3G3C123_ACTDE|nr:beta-glucosidase 6 [Actinidia deliciosa]